ncbi:MAG: hypothetical protein ABIG71_04325, partial [Candidatus Uhrbacteria bacterium]
RPVSVVRQSFYPDFGKFAEHITLYADGERIIEYVRASTVQLLAKQIGRDIAVQLYLARRKFEEHAPMISAGLSLLGIDPNKALRKLLGPLAPKRKRKSRAKKK